MLSSALMPLHAIQSFNIDDAHSFNLEESPGDVRNLGLCLVVQFWSSHLGNVAPRAFASAIAAGAASCFGSRHAAGVLAADPREGRIRRL